MIMYLYQIRYQCTFSNRSHTSHVTDQAGIFLIKFSFCALFFLSLTADLASKVAVATWPQDEVRQAAQPQLRLMAELEVARLGEVRTEAANIMVETKRPRPER